MTYFKTFLSLSFVFLLTACGGLSGSNDISQVSPVSQGQNLPQFSQDGLACPTVGIVEDLRSITLFDDNSKPDPNQIIGYAKINDFSGSCVYENGFLEVDMNVLFSARAGARRAFERETERTIAYPYFVAVADEQGNILRKEVFAVAMRFIEGKDTSTQADRIKPRIAISNAQLGQNYQILVGFQLTRQQLSFNRGG